MLLRSLCLLAVAGSAVATLAKPRPAAVRSTPLDTYTATQDPAFAWEIVQRIDQPGHTELIVDLTSQRWRSGKEISQPEWHHWLSIVLPRQATAETALLYIGGGSNEADAPTRASGQIRSVALATQTVVAELRMVPNQPLRVLSSNAPDRDRYEDDLLAASWVECMETGDPTWLAQLPMAKSAVAAMDAVQEALAEEADAPAIRQFTVAGASKRGWTSWLAAAVDDRVAGVVPIVIDMLNIAPSIRHHHTCYGFYSEALGDYERAGLADRLTSAEGAAIREIVDPYAYRGRLTIPKCLINASGDQFFLPDSSRFYFDDLVGEKHLSYTPNTGHGLGNTNALDTLVAFHASIAHGLTCPTVTWTGGHSSAAHTVTCTAQPTEAILWRAVNPTARDFRHNIVGDAYQPTPIEPEADGTYHIPIEPPEEGFSATFARFTFDIGAPQPFRVSTPVWVAPDVEPFAGKD